MLIVHHLNNSRSQRILWLLEELGTPYEIKKYQRLTPVPLAPPELKNVHPLGKSPVITDGDLTIAESGAIIEYILDTYGNGKLKPARGTRDYWKYIEWLHFAEGSAVLPLMMNMYAGFVGEGMAPLRPRIDSEIANHLGYVSKALEGRQYLVGDSLSGADVQMTFVFEAAQAGGVLKDYPVLIAYLERMRARPAFQRAIEKGGPYDLSANRRPPSG